ELVRVLAAEGPVIVVDDGSRDGSAERAATAGARVIANAGRPGPAGARNTGLRAAETELAAFVDADCVVAPGWRRGLAELLAADPEMAIVAPRVRSRPADSACGPGGLLAADRQVAMVGPWARSSRADSTCGSEPGLGAPRARSGTVESVLARYEEGNSPLDLGAAPSLVGPGRRVAYLPAAALLARRDALLELGGFDESMRFGEDVDLVWRLLAAGGQARYVPAREVIHRPRPTLRALIAQRAGYGSSAPHLRRRHGAAVSPLRLNRHSAAIWSVAALRPRLAPVALAASVAIVASRGSDAQARLGLAEVALRGQLDGAGHLTRALAREWLPLSLAAGVACRRARHPLAVALLLGTLGGPIESIALHAVDQGAYAAGLWREMVAQREFGAILLSWGLDGRRISIRQHPMRRGVAKAVDAGPTRVF
ncbi:MAG TPA: glycosyltransferase, partial [Solirubrobacterales bacterium]|nr:glycosyltransferase [Solirubrobacterales bacterium]